MLNDSPLPGDGVDPYLTIFGLDDLACQCLRDLQPALHLALPEMARAFYATLAGIPSLAPLVATAGQVERLIKAQVRHWDDLFHGRLNADYFARARHVGQVHERIGLQPRFFIGAYAHFMDEIFALVLERGWSTARTRVALGAVMRAALLDMELALSAYAEIGEASRLKSELLLLTDRIERDMDETVADISARSTRTARIADQIERTALDRAQVNAKAADLREHASVINDQLVGLRQRINALLRSSRSGARRRMPRRPIVIGMDASFGVWRSKGMTVDLSSDGCLLKADQQDFPPGCRGVVALDGIGTLSAHVVSVGPTGVHVHFDDVDDRAHAAILTLLRSVTAGGSAP